MIYNLKELNKKLNDLEVENMKLKNIIFELEKDKTFLQVSLRNYKQGFNKAYEMTLENYYN